MACNRLALALLFAVAAVSAHAADQNISKVNGAITVEDGERYGHLETVNGSIHIGTNARVGNAETVNGSIEVASGTQTGSLETVNGGVRVESKVMAAGDISTVNGEIFVNRGGVVRGGVETVNGAIGLVDADVNGGIKTVNGDVTVGVGSHVRGGLRYTRPSKPFISFGKPRVPRVVIGPNAQVDGPLVFEREVKLYVHRSAKIGPVSGATVQRFDGAVPQD